VIDDSEFVVIARVRRAHGTRGEITVEPLSDFPERLNSLKEVLIKEDDRKPLRVGIESIRWKGGLALVKLAGVDDRTRAGEYAGSLLGLTRADIPPAGAEEYYFFDLVGCKVVDGSGEEVGVVDEVLRMPANDVLVVRAARDPEAGKEMLIPAVKQVVKKVDLDAGTITIEPIPGLLDG
jgi:16S rRNA processing protein RimM